MQIIPASKFHEAVRKYDGKELFACRSKHTFQFQITPLLTCKVQVTGLVKIGTDAVGDLYYASQGESIAFYQYGESSNTFSFYGRGARGPLLYSFMNDFNVVLTGKKMY